MQTLVVAGLSARLMAEAAARDGYAPLALDVFGDADTRAAASRWAAIGEPGRLRIDADRLLAALAGLARDGGVAGWVAGSGFEDQPGLLAQGAALLPLIGSTPDAVARLRDAVAFFGFLHASDIDHPPVWLPDVQSGWLLKDANACGGLHIRRLQPGQYLQRETAGLPLSATFVANGSDVRLLGCNLQLVRSVGARPHVWCGVVGPVPVAQTVQRRLTAIAGRIAAGFALRGLASLDVLLDGDRVLVLEVNPRPPASMALYAERRPMAAHVRACLDGELPAPSGTDTPPRGLEIVRPRGALRLTPEQALWLQRQPGVHDLPGAGQTFAAGDPLCSVSVEGTGVDDVVARLAEKREMLLQTLESAP